MKRLNIFVDETGEFGFSKGSAKLYGVSLVFHEQKNNIKPALKILDRRFDDLGFCGMVHMGDLVMGHGDFAEMTIAERRKIYTTLSKFAEQVNAKYYTILIDKKNANTTVLLGRKISREFEKIIADHLNYFQSFDKIMLYYDGGQIDLSKIIKNTFGRLGGYERKPKFDHTDKKLFQVADMLTYVDKIIYKHNRGDKLTKTERRFFTKKHISTITKNLKSHRF